MRRGFIIGKFLPLHRGHLALVDFAQQHCDLLYVLVCSAKTESIDGMVRQQWLYQELGDRPGIRILSFPYNEEKLPNTSVSSREVSQKWAIALKEIVPDAEIVFTSEPYGDYLAEYMNIKHIPFDEKRITAPVSASAILKDPFTNWGYISKVARPWFVKKIVLLGSESTGKSVLAERLATHFNTSHVPEAAREIIEKTDECRFEDLEKIAALHAKRIGQAIGDANMLLFIDTDITITKSYARFLFNRELEVHPWVTEANKADLYLFLEADSPFIQDGTRLGKDQRDQLSLYHKEELRRNNIEYVSLVGSWDERFNLAVAIIEDKYFPGHA